MCVYVCVSAYASVCERERQREIEWKKEREWIEREKERERRGGGDKCSHFAGSSCHRAFIFHIHHSESKNGKVLNAKCCTADGCNVLEAHNVTKAVRQFSQDPCALWVHYFKARLFFFWCKNASSGKIPREIEVAAVAEILGRVQPVFGALGCSLHINADTPGRIQNEDGGPLPWFFSLQDFATSLCDVANIPRSHCDDSSASSQCAHALRGIGNLSSAS